MRLQHVKNLSKLFKNHILCNSMKQIVFATVYLKQKFDSAALELHENAFETQCIYAKMSKAQQKRTVY